MILIPEIETIVILVPRTGSGSLKRAILKTYSKAHVLYRHMEADGVPHGYDRWRRVGVARNPLDRLWSLYKFCQGDGLRTNYPAFAERQKRAVAMSFGEWLLFNDVVFTDPYDSEGSLKFWPEYTVLHSLPENRKSQFVYLRPDLGTQVVPFNLYMDLCRELRIGVPPVVNSTDYRSPPPISAQAQAHVERFFSWDISVTAEERAA